MSPSPSVEASVLTGVFFRCHVFLISLRSLISVLVLLRQRPAPLPNATWLSDNGGTGTRWPLGVPAGLGSLTQGADGLLRVCGKSGLCFSFFSEFCSTGQNMA